MESNLKNKQKKEFFVSSELLKFFLENDFIIYWKKDNKSDKKMTEIYSGKLEERGKVLRKSEQVGLLRIEDDKLVFIFDSGNITEIKFEEIDSVIPQRVRFPKGLKEPLITLKDGREFILGILPTYTRSGLLEGMRGVHGAVSDNFRAIKQGNIQMTKLLNYLIKK